MAVAVALPSKTMVEGSNFVCCLGGWKITTWLQEEENDGCVDEGVMGGREEDENIYSEYPNSFNTASSEVCEKRKSSLSVPAAERNAFPRSLFTSVKKPERREERVREEKGGVKGRRVGGVCC